MSPRLAARRHRDERRRDGQEENRRTASVRRATFFQKAPILGDFASRCRVPLYRRWCPVRPAQSGRRLRLYRPIRPLRPAPEFRGPRADVQRHLQEHAPRLLPADLHPHSLHRLSPHALRPPASTRPACPSICWLSARPTRFFASSFHPSRLPSAGALLFAFHPIHVEAVAWIMAGGYAIAGDIGALLSFALYLSKRTWASTFVFAAAALTNPPAVVVPALLGGHMWLLPATSTEEGRRRRRNLGGMAAAAAVVVYLNFVVFPQRYARAFFDSAVAARSWLANFFAYLRLMVVPLGLTESLMKATSRTRSIRASWREPPASCWSARGSWLYRGKRSPLMSFGLFWFLAGVATVTVWKNATGMADRYVFIASFGFVLAAIAIYRRGLVAALGRPVGAKATAALGVLFLVFFAAVTGAACGSGTIPRRCSPTRLARILATFSRRGHSGVTTPSPHRRHKRPCPFLRDYPADSGTTRQARQCVPSALRIYNLSELCNELGIVSRELSQYEKQ